MERFSAFRDPGTGIQPFLTPVPSSESDLIAKLIFPIGYVVGIIRTLLVLMLLLLYIVLVLGICQLLKPIPPFYRLISWIITSLLARMALFLVGFWWIPVEIVTRKRGRASVIREGITIKAGDIIVSNWVSWIEILWLAFRFNPIWVLPVSESPARSAENLISSSPLTQTPGRRTGTGSAALSSPSRTPSTRQPILGFREVSLLSILRATGKFPPFFSDTSSQKLEDIRRAANRPVVVFPECTTSNGRALLAFADIFKGVDIPVRDFNLFIICVRYDPPTTMKPSLSHSLPSGSLGPLKHIFQISTTLAPQSISIRILSPSESPSSASFMTSEIVPERREDVLSEACATLIAQIGKVKRIRMGWEDKVAFYDFYRSKETPLSQKRSQQKY